MHCIAVEKLWIAFGTDKHFRYIPVPKIAAVLGNDRCTRCTASPIFRATTSSFVGKGKKSAWDAWDALLDLTGALH